MNFGLLFFLNFPRFNKMKQELYPVPREIVRDLQYDLIDVKLFQKGVLER